MPRVMRVATGAAWESSRLVAALSRYASSSPLVALKGPLLGVSSAGVEQLKVY